MTEINATPSITVGSTVTPANNINSPGRSIPTKAQSESHVNQIKSATYSHVNGPTFYPMKAKNGNTA